MWWAIRDSLAPKLPLCDRPGRYDAIVWHQLRRQYSLNFYVPSVRPFESLNLFLRIQKTPPCDGGTLPAESIALAHPFLYYNNSFFSLCELFFIPFFIFFIFTFPFVYFSLYKKITFLLHKIFICGKIFIKY